MEINKFDGGQQTIHEHKVFEAIDKGKTADDELSGKEDTGMELDTSERTKYHVKKTDSLVSGDSMANSRLVATGGAPTYGPSEELILQNWLPWLGVTMGIISINIELLAQWGTMRDLDTEAVALLR